MAVEKRFTQATWRIMEQLLEVDSIGDALSGSLEIIYNTLNSANPQNLSEQLLYAQIKKAYDKLENLIEKNKERGDR